MTFKELNSADAKDFFEFQKDNFIDFWSEPDQKSLHGHDGCDGSIDDSYLYHWFASTCTGVGIEYSAA